MNNDLRETHCARSFTDLQEAYAAIELILKHDDGEMDSLSVEALEKEILKITNGLATHIMASRLQAQLESETQRAQEKEVIDALPGKLRDEGRERVNIRTATGLTIALTLRYYRRRCDKKPGKRHKGVYPAFLVLGLHERTTPLLASRVSAWSALLSSFVEVQQILLEHSIDLNVKVLRRIAYGYAQRARRHQEQCPLMFKEDDTLKGQRVVISCDGGRVRLREKKRGPKTPKGRTRYTGAWREPKLLIIYVVNADGRQEKQFAPIIDGCLQGPDIIFERIVCYLKALKVSEADHVLFIADGAHWIWHRASVLMRELGLQDTQVHELIDFYHAVEHVSKIAALRKHLTPSERKKWVSKQRRRLQKGQVETVVEEIQGFCRGRLSKALRTERDYFVRNQKRMNYAEIKALNLPIGSGAIESSVRRVINLRLKGPCIFWLRENAEKILMLRAYFKAGRWNMLKSMANSTQIFMTC